MRDQVRQCDGPYRTRLARCAVTVALPAIIILCLTPGCSRARSSEVAAASALPSPGVASAKAGVPDMDTCSLLTRAEVEAVFGELKGTPRADRGLRNERECRFANAKGQWLEFSVYGTERWELEKGSVSERHPETVPNLGEEAFSVLLGTENNLYVRTGAAVLQTSGSCSLDTIKTLAAKATLRLESR